MKRKKKMTSSAVFFFFFLGYKAFNPPVQDAILLKKNCNVRLCKMCF